MSSHYFKQFHIFQIKWAFPAIRAVKARAIDTIDGFLLLYIPMTTYSIASLAIMVSMAALVLNLPFGYLRMNTRKLSFMWFVYIHLPIPAIFILRNIAGLDYKFIPLMVVGAVAGQFLGGRLNRKASPNG